MVSDEGLCAYTVSEVIMSGGVNGLSGCAEPGTERTRMGGRLMISVIDFVRDDMRACQPHQGTQHRREGEHETKSGLRFHKLSSHPVKGPALMRPVVSAPLRFPPLFTRAEGKYL
jgi:hypothetical protein